MEDFLALAKKRCSVRKFLPRLVEDEKLELILESARIAPTAKNTQPFRLLVLNTPEALEKLSGAYRSFGAPLAILICGDNNETWVRSFDAKDTLEIDASIITDHMMLEAESLGLSTCWICAFNPNAIRTIFNIPGHLTPVNLLVIGYAADQKKNADRHDTERRPISELVVYDSF